MTPPVHLVGAGPGDPQLLTLRGRDLLTQADAVLYDHLAPTALLDLAPAHAERIYVGKKKSVHSHTQEEICQMMIDRARRGLRVVRLKGGDPYIFGRGGEEAEALAAAGVPFEVVPGVTSPLGLAAYAGVPLTHRDHTSVVTFVTGHNAEGIDWSKVGLAETLVIFMGLTTFPQIARELIANGRAPDTPAIAVRWATRADQETVVGTLETLPGLIEARGLKPPATIVVGEVVRLRETLDWFGRLPLHGQCIVVTRPRDQAPVLSSRLRELGADVIECPAIEIQPAVSYAGLDRAIAKLESYDFLLFTSANGVEHFLARLDASGKDARAIRGKLGVIGPATRAALESVHLKVDVMATEFVAEGLLRALASHEMTGRRVLLARAAKARDVLPQELRRRRATVDVVEAYRSVAPDGLADRVRKILTAPRRPDWITFTSSSTVENFVEAAGGQDLLAGVRIASIGPITSATATRHGIHIDAEASSFDVEGLIGALMPAGIMKS